MAKVYGDRWETVRSLKPGGQAETFVVRDLNRSDDEEFVLKRVRNPARHDRFTREVELLQNLKHPNIVQILDAHLDGDKPYLVMEFCRGGSLEEHKGRWDSDPAAALEMFAQICDGVAAAHAQGVTHRDIKPANILMKAAEGPPQVADFGIAFVADGERHTLTDEAVGARLFTPPELADGRADLVTARSDVYSLGKLLYWLLSGGRLFDREQHRDGRYDLARAGQLRPPLEHINRLLDRMIVLEPSRRYANAADAAAAARFTADILRRGVRVLAPDLPQECVFCKHGQYEAIRILNATDVRNFGLTPVGTAEWRILVCDHCGNVQLFRPNYTRKEWWGPEGKLPPAQ